MLQLVPTNGEEFTAKPKGHSNIRADVLSAKHASFSIALTPILWTSTSIGFAVCSQYEGAPYRRFRPSSLSSHRWHCPASLKSCSGQNGWFVICDVTVEGAGNTGRIGHLFALWPV
jgi:hypothetical protein